MLSSEILLLNQGTRIRITKFKKGIERTESSLRKKLAQEDLLDEFAEGGLYTKYLIGEIHADFLDDDNLLDIATSNRQEIKKNDKSFRGTT